MNLRIITLNCWGIPILSKNKNVRMEAIAEELARDCYDIVCLQEVWSNSDYNLIKTKVENILPYAHYFHSGVIGSGICIISRYPIQETFFHQWSVNGYVHKLHHGDWFGGKGVGLCRIQVNNCDIDIYSAHLHAEYDRNCDEYLTHRVLQAFDTAQFIRLTSKRTDLVILAGDLNTEPGDLAYRIMTSTAGLADAYVEAGDIARPFSSTNECYTNSYTSAELVKQRFEGKRIDYIMYRVGSDISAVVTTFEHPLPQRVAGYDFSYSDHEAVSATIRLSRRTAHSSALSLTEDAINNYRVILEESMRICDDALARLTHHRRLWWFLTAALVSLLAASIDMDAPYNYTKTFHVARFLGTAVFCFTLVMATLWNSIEQNAVLAGKANMDVHLRRLLHTD